MNGIETRYCPVCNTDWQGDEIREQVQVYTDINKGW